VGDHRAIVARAEENRSAAAMRELVNAIFYVLRSGCPWRMVPTNFAPHSTVYRWFLRLRDERVFETINYHLLIRDRERVGHAFRHAECSRSSPRGRRQRLSGQETSQRET